jgi:molybdate transport system regulatory protein
MLDDVKPVVKIFFASPGGRGKPFCGPGMIKLLDNISKTGNVRQACENMNMSYSKGWKLLNAVDKWLMYPVTARQQGGKGGGEARLTEKGAEFLAKHRAFQTECEEAVNKIFTKYYAGAVPDTDAGF